MPSLYNLAEEGLLPDQFAIIGVARSGTTVECVKEQFARSDRERRGHPVDQVSSIA